MRTQMSEWTKITIVCPNCGSNQVRVTGGRTNNLICLNCGLQDKEENFEVKDLPDSL